MRRGEAFNHSQEVCLCNLPRRILVSLPTSDKVFTGSFPYCTACQTR